MYSADTIAAISTPLGEGGIGIIRISGPEALPLLGKIFRPVNSGGFQSHRFYYGEVLNPVSGLVLDEVMAVFMQNPRSFTREDVVEIHCHGGTLIVQQLLDLVLHTGARLAEPGEFTKRAFLNGRIDLVQAESIIDIIRAKTDFSASLAQHQRDGSVSAQLIAIRDDIRQMLALVEAYVDFPEEDLGATDLSRLFVLADAALEQSRFLTQSYVEGKVLRDGVSVIIAGKPNVGKSSLLNTLLREKRAIVTSMPGTTRDLIEEVVNIRGLPVKLLDTAGIRSSADPVEQEGIRLAMARIPAADLALYLLDSSRPFDADDRLVADSLAGSNYILVLNKCDLEGKLEIPADQVAKPCISISTADGSGIDGLKDAVADMFLHGKAEDKRELVMLSRSRHRDALLRVEESLLRFVCALKESAAYELLALDLRDALDAIGEITGETTPDDILDLIFAQFCIGK